MLKIKRYISNILCEQQNHLSQSVRVAYFVENVRISPSHVGNDYIRFADLVENSVQNPFRKSLLINSFSVGSDIVCSPFNPELVYVIECSIERHENENEGLWLSRNRGHS